jgi:hypothetical protein
MIRHPSEVAATPAAGAADSQQPPGNAGSDAELLPMQLDPPNDDGMQDLHMGGSGGSDNDDADGSSIARLQRVVGSDVAVNLHGSSPLVRVSVNRRAADFACSSRTGPQRKLRWSFIGLQFVQFADCEQLMGWCKGGTCAGGNSRLYEQVEGVDKPDQQKAAWLGDTPPLCPCSEQLVRSLGGQGRLRQLMSILRRSAHSPAKGQSMTRNAFVCVTR